MTDLCLRASTARCLCAWTGSVQAHRQRAVGLRAWTDLYLRASTRPAAGRLRVGGMNRAVCKQSNFHWFEPEPVK